MVTLTSLWLPILLSAVVVFFASWFMHMILHYHRSNFARIADEDAVRTALRPYNIPPGDYTVPHMKSEADLKSAAYREKLAEGPVLLLTVLPNSVPSMGKSLGLWFLYCLATALIAAYLAGRTLVPGAEYLEVFRVVGTVGFLGYAFAFLQDSIWFGRKWSTTFKFLFDGLVYGLLTAGIFGWLWPGNG